MVIIIELMPGVAGEGKRVGAVFLVVVNTMLNLMDMCVGGDTCEMALSLASPFPCPCLVCATAAFSTQLS